MSSLCITSVRLVLLIAEVHASDVGTDDRQSKLQVEGKPSTISVSSNEQLVELNFFAVFVSISY